MDDEEIENDPEVVSACEMFLEEHHADDLEALAASGGGPLYVEHGQLDRVVPSIAADYITHPKRYNAAFRAAVNWLEVDGLRGDDVFVRLTDNEGNLPRIRVAGLRAKHLGTFVAVEGQLAKVSGVTPRFTEIVFECQRCTNTVSIPQSVRGVQEPYTCGPCEQKGIWDPQRDDSPTVDERTLKLETPPGERVRATADSVIAYTDRDLCHVGGDNGLADRAGERVVVLGRYEADIDEVKKGNRPTTEGYLIAESVVFPSTDFGDVTVEETKDQFRRLAYGTAGDPVELLKDSIAPQLYRTDELDRVLEAAVGWLFNGYRMESEDGDQVRGDLHMAVIGDPSTGKSTILSSLHRIAPKSIYRSGGSMTEVGLTAAAQQEEFAGKTQWTLEPGALPRANGGHCIIDEVDVLLDKETKAIHDALEGDQMVKVDKAGISADLPSRTALLISGNPEMGRFDPMEPISEQFDMDPALISRMDILLPVTDVVDRDRDAQIASHLLDTYVRMSEAERKRRAVDEDVDVSPTGRPVPIQVFRDWVFYARENCFPTLSEDALASIEDLYIDVRDLNEGYQRPDEPIPATSRVIGAAVRLSTAFARVELSDVVQPHHVDRAKHIIQATIKMNFDKETGEWDADRTTEAKPKSQRDRIKSIKSIIDDLNFDGEATREAVIDTAAAEYGLDRSKAEHELEKLSQRGEVYEPPDGGIRTT